MKSLNVHFLETAQMAEIFVKSFEKNFPEVLQKWLKRVKKNPAFRRGSIYKSAGKNA
jgi:hypothetical protein